MKKLTGTVLKFRAPTSEGVHDVEMQKGAQIVCMKADYNEVKIWAIANPKSKSMVKRKVAVVHTGKPAPKGFQYFNSFDSSPTLHIFLGGEVSVKAKTPKKAKGKIPARAKRSKSN